MHYVEAMLPEAAQETTHRKRRRAPPPPLVGPVLPITFAEQHGADAVPAKYSMEPGKAIPRKVADVAGVGSLATDMSEYAVASSLRSSQSGRSSVSSAPSVRSSVSYLTRETTARGLFRKRKTVIDCGVINKFDNG